MDSVDACKMQNLIACCYHGMEIIPLYQMVDPMVLNDLAKILKHARQRNVPSSVIVSIPYRHTDVSVCQGILARSARLLSLVLIIHAVTGEPAPTLKRMES